jgi:hypothetical protein
LKGVLWRSWRRHIGSNSHLAKADKIENAPDKVPNGHHGARIRYLPVQPRKGFGHFSRLPSSAVLATEITTRNHSTEKETQQMRNKIINYIRSGYAGIYLVSPEEQRVEAELKGIAREVSFKLYAWSTTSGLIDTDKGSARQVNDPMDALLAIQELPEKTIVVLRDFHILTVIPIPCSCGS